MNIFYLHNDQRTCAQEHVDKHCVKMILEYAQLLSTAHRVLDGTLFEGYSKTGRKQKRYVLSDEREPILYTATHINHPSAIWARQSLVNYHWLFKMFIELMREYHYRYGKIHSCMRLVTHLRFPPTKIPLGEFTEPTPAMPEQYRVAGDSIQSYKNYYFGDKSHMFKWKNRPTPSWIS
jgi:hypothetical protein